MVGFRKHVAPKKKRGSDSVLKKHLADRPRLFCLARGNALILVGLLKFNLKAQAGQTSARETGGALSLFMGVAATALTQH